jgi:hypothetical protein
VSLNCNILSIISLNIALLMLDLDINNKTVNKLKINLFPWWWKCIIIWYGLDDRRSTGGIIMIKYINQVGKTLKIKRLIVPRLDNEWFSRMPLIGGNVHPLFGFIRGKTGELFENIFTLTHKYVNEARLFLPPACWW